MSSSSVVLLINLELTVNAKDPKLDIQNLIQKYISGSLSLEESRRLSEWVNLNPDNKRLIKQLKHIWELVPEEEFEVNVEKAWEQFSQNRSVKGEPGGKIRKIDRRYLEKLTFVFRAAAVVLVALATGFFLQSYNSNTVESESSSQFYVMQEVVTGEGERTSITFSDGTRVTLNSSSYLRFPRQFDAQERIIYLEGEAYFEVAEDPDHPFIVDVRNTKVQVLGTKFNVKGWEEDTSIDVVVREGSVSVNVSESQESQTDEVILNEGDYVRVYDEMGISDIQAVDVDTHILWLVGGMYFDNVPFEQVLRTLERKYAVEFSVADSSILEVPFTSTFQQAELNEILSVIAATMEVGYVREGSTIEFR